MKSDASSFFLFARLVNTPTLAPRLLITLLDCSPQCKKSGLQ